MQIGKIPVRISPLFFLTAGLIGFINSFSLMGTVIWVVIIFVSVLVHEMGHAVFSRLFGQNPRVELVLFGGVTYPQSTQRIALWKEFIVVLAGPCFGFFLFALTFFALHFPIDNQMVKATLFITAIVNLFWSMINLIPILPLDGGHLMRIIFEGIFGAKGWRIALMASFVIAGVGGVGFLLLGNIFLAIILFLFAFQNLETFRRTKGFTDADRNDGLIAKFEEAEKLEVHGLKEEALSAFDAVRQEAKKGMLFVKASYRYANILAQIGRHHEAYAIMKEIKADIPPEALCFYVELASKNQDYNAVVTMANECFQYAPSKEVALMVAEAHTVLGNEELAQKWAETAKQL